MLRSESSRTRCRSLVPTLAAIGCAALLAACGSSTSHSSSGDSPGFVAGVKYSDCMRSHGVPNFPDPGSGGGIQIGSGINPSSPSFQSAQSDCAKLMPGPNGGRKASESQKIGMFRLARCMRQHGVTGFPDPVATAPAPGAGLGIAFGAPGSFIAVPQAMLQSPAFKQAASVCGFPGAGRAGGPKATLSIG